MWSSLYYCRVISDNGEMRRTLKLRPDTRGHAYWPPTTIRPYTAATWEQYCPVNDEPNIVRYHTTGRPTPRLDLDITNYVLLWRFVFKLLWYNVICFKLFQLFPGESPYITHKYRMGHERKLATEEASLANFSALPQVRWRYDTHPIVGR